MDDRSECRTWTVSPNPLPTGGFRWSCDQCGDGKFWYRTETEAELAARNHVASRSPVVPEPKRGVARLVALLSDLNDGARITLTYDPHRGGQYRWIVYKDEGQHDGGHGSEMWVALYGALTAALTAIFRQDPDGDGGF